MPKFRVVLLILLLLSLIGCEGHSSSSGEEQPANGQQPPAEFEGTIVAVGDSLTEGLGVAEESAYPALLERKLAAKGYNYRVINAGVSGETSSAVLSRIKWVLTLKPDIVVLVTGANDGLRGVDPSLTKTNLDKIVKVLQDHNVTIVLGGMRMVQNLGEEYTKAFADIYPEIAEAHQLIFIPFFLNGVAGDPRLNQTDGIHPTAEGYRIIVDNIYPHVVEAIKRHRAGQK